MIATPGAPAPAGVDRILSGRDLVATAGLALLLPIAWGLPERRWPAVSRIVGGAILRAGLGAGGSAPALGATIRRVLGDRRIAVDPDAIRTKQAANHVETLFLLLRSRRPGAWRPSAVLDGRARIDAALAAGRGVVLLFHRFRPFVHLAALGAAGFQVSRLSDEDHGYFSRTKIGRRWLNRLQVALEDAGGVERIVAIRGSLAHLRQLRDRLAQNRVVVMPTYAAGTRTVDVPFMQGRLTWGTTPFRLAVEADAPLLPIYAISETPGSFRVLVEGAIDLRAAGTRPRPVDEVVRDYAARLEASVLRFPEQWTEWSAVKLV